MVEKNNTFVRFFLLLAGPAWNKPIARTQYVPIRQISRKYYYVVSPTHKTLNNEACIGVIGIQDICHFTSRDIGYYPFYFQGYRILCSISGIEMCFCRKIKKKQKKTTVKVPLKDESLKRKRLSGRFF